MAAVLIDAHHLLQLLSREVGSRSTHDVRFGGPDDQLIDGMKEAANWALFQTTGSNLIALDERERQIIEPYLSEPLE